MAARGPTRATIQTNHFFKSYIEKYDLDKRKEMAANLVSKHPSRIPIVIFNGAPDKMKFTEIKYPLSPSRLLVEREKPLSFIITYMKAKIALNPSESLFLFINNRVCPPRKSLSHSVSLNLNAVHEQYHEEDGFLYCLCQVHEDKGAF